MFYSLRVWRPKLRPCAPWAASETQGSPQLDPFSLPSLMKLALIVATQQPARTVRARPLQHKMFVQVFFFRNLKTALSSWSLSRLRLVNIADTPTGHAQAASH